MLKRTEVFLKQLVLLLDCAAVTAAFSLTYVVRQQLHEFYRLNLVPHHVVFEPLTDVSSYGGLLLVALPLWLGMLHLMGGYRELRVKTYPHILWTLVQASAMSLLLFGSVMFLMRLHYVSRSFVLLFFALSLLLLAVDRGLLSICFRLLLLRGYFHRNLLIVGTGRRARAFIKSVHQHADWGLRLIGLLDRDVQMIGHRVAGTTILGTLDDLPRVLREHVVDEVIFVVPRAWMSHLEPAILECELAGVRATVAMDLFNIQIARSNPSEHDGIPVLSYETTPQDQWQLAAKRLVDLVVAMAGLAALAPVFLSVAALIKLGSPGPVFFKQTRCGLNGRLFQIYKFRSMVADAEAKQDALRHLNEVQGPVFKITNDPRMTRIGAFIRKTSIDELPQLINVFRGEMSLVGPRPPIPSEVKKYEKWQRRRLSMRPGITGWWQVSGRSNISDFDQWMRLDLEYIDKWSLLLDLRILLKTVPAVLMGTGAK